MYQLYLDTGFYRMPRREYFLGGDKMEGKGLRGRKKSRDIFGGNGKVFLAGI